MSNNQDAVLAAIQLLSQQMNLRFDSVEAAAAVTNDRLDKLNGRVRKTERSLTSTKAVGSAFAALAVFLGWDTVKLWLISLMR